MTNDIKQPRPSPIAVEDNPFGQVPLEIQVRGPLYYSNELPMRLEEFINDPGLIGP